MNEEPASWHEPAPFSALHQLRAAPWGIGDLAVSLAVGLGLFLIIVLTAGLIAAFNDLPAHPGRELAFGLAATFLFDVCLLAIALSVALKRYGLNLAGYGYRRFPLSEVALALCGVVSIFVMLALYVGFTRLLHLDKLVPQPNLPKGTFDFPDLTIATGIEACLVAPFIEESFFRGFLFRGLLDRPLSFRFLGLIRLSHYSGFWTAALTSGMLFAVLHGQLGLLIPFTAVGTLFAWLFWRSGSLWPNILAHAGFNTVSFVASLVTHH